MNQYLKEVQLYHYFSEVGSHIILVNPYYKYYHMCNKLEQKICSDWVDILCCEKTGPILLLLVGFIAGWQIGKWNMGGFQIFKIL